MLEERVKELDLVYKRGTPRPGRLKYLSPSSFYLPTSERVGKLGTFLFLVDVEKRTLGSESKASQYSQQVC